MTTKIDKRRNPTRMIQPWRPLTWKPIYDLMVSLFVQGHTHIEIADLTGYSKEAVGLILRSPETQNRTKQLAQGLQANMLSNVETQMNAMKLRAMNNVSDVLFNDVVLDKRPMESARLSLEFLKGLGTLGGGGAAVQINNTINNNAPQQFNTTINNKEMLTRLVDGIEKANLAVELNKEDK